MPLTQDVACVRIARTFKAPRQRVFDAWVNPEYRQQWWGARPGMYCDLCNIDPRSGGQYRINMKNPQADGEREWITVGEFIEYDAPNKLVFTWSWEQPDPTEPGTGAKNTVVTVEFHDVEGGTQVVLTHEGFATEQLRDEHNQGWDGCLASLATFIES